MIVLYVLIMVLILAWPIWLALLIDACKRTR